MNNPIVLVDSQGDTVRVYVETHKFGHSWISVGEGEKMTVYSYGRYDGTYKHTEISNGRGVLLRFSGEDARQYNEDKSNIGYHTFTITDISDDSVSKILDAKFDSSNDLPRDEKSAYYRNPTAHVIDEYKFLSNNCTTVVSDALNEAGSNVLKETRIQQASTVGSYTTRPVIHRFINPRSLLLYLEKSNLPYEYVKK